MTVQHPCPTLFESIGQDDAVFAELVDMFLDDSAPRLTAIRDAIDAGDTATLAREAHTFKGAAAMLEADDVTRCAQELELLGRGGSVSGAREIADCLEVHSAALFDVIRRFRTAFNAAA